MEMELSNLSSRLVGTVSPRPPNQVGRARNILSRLLRVSLPIRAGQGMGFILSSGITTSET